MELQQLSQPLDFYQVYCYVESSQDLSLNDFFVSSGDLGNTYYYTIEMASEDPLYDGGVLTGLDFDAMLIIFVVSMICGFGLSLMLSLLGWIIKVVGKLLRKGGV